jgi:DNA primase
MSSTVEQIKEKLGIADVVGSYIKLEAAGGNYKAKCPFHNEKTASFFISPSRGTYYCFGCQAKGDIFTFVQEYEKVDFKEALKELADKAGVKLSRGTESRQMSDERERLFEAVEEAVAFYEHKFKEDTSAQEYLKSRGLSEKTSAEWRIGLAPSSWNMLQEHLKGKGYSDNDMEKAGLIKRGDKGFYDRFRSRIMFPLFNGTGRPVGFSGRIVEGASAESQASAKYLNSPDGALFNKSELLYGLHKAKLGIREKGYAILVEGQMDLLAMHQAGFPQTVATSGTALTIQQLDMLHRISPNLLIVYDGDTAGSNAAIRAWSLGLQTGMDVKIAALPTGSDPADMATKDIESLKNALRNSKHVIDFLLDRLLSSNLQDRKLVQAIERDVLPYVAMVSSSIEQSYFVSRIAERARINEESLWVELKKLKTGDRTQFVRSSESKEEAFSLDIDVLSRRILGIIFRFEEIDAAKASLIQESFGKLMAGEYDSIFQKALAQKEALMFEAEAEGLLNTLRIEKIKKEFETTMSALHAAEHNKDQDLISELLKKCHELSLQLEILYKHN